MNDESFAVLAGHGLSRSMALVSERQKQYGDSWGGCPWTQMRSVAEALGLEEMDAAELTCLALAAFCDQKWQRQAQGYKADTLDDEVNYLAALREKVSRVLARRSETPASGRGGPEPPHSSPPRPGTA